MPKAATKSRGAVTGQLAIEMPAPAAQTVAVAAAPIAPPVRPTLTPRYGDLEPTPPIAQTAALPPPSIDQVVAAARALVNAQRPAEPFGGWLLKQKSRGGLIGALATAAAADRGFPKTGTPQDVRGRLETVGADGDMHAALDNAETDWMAI